MSLCDNCDTEFTDTIMCDCEDKEYWQLHDLRQEKQMKLTRRGWIVLVIIPAIVALYGMYELVGHIWWVGDHYCWGEMTECYFPNE